MDYLIANWPWVLIILLIIVVVAWWAMGGNTDESIEADDGDNILSKAASAATGAVASTAETIKDTAEAAVDTAATATEKVADGAGVAVEAAKDTAGNIAESVGDAVDSLKPKIAAAVGDPDDLRKIKGVGPKLNTLLGELGVSRYDQIAAWNDADIAEVDQHLGNFKGRIARDNWADQAGYLAKDDITGFEAKYGKL